jgi:3-isopropylmalate/(R)-2-methylmalate dehydratase small subunit
VEKVQEGDIIVAGKNFGCGSSREHSPVAIKAAGINAVVAESFARIFFRNAINIGLPLFVLSDVNGIDDGDIVELDVGKGVISNSTKGTEFKADPLPDFIQSIVEKGGLINFLRDDGYI